MRSKSKNSNLKHYWKVWLRTAEQRVAAFTVCLMLVLGILVGGEPHRQIDVNAPEPTTQVTMVVTGNSSSGTVTFDSTSATMTFGSHFGKLPGDSKS
jgi:hypothetical protein